MNHILDNPIWEGLQSGNRHFALGNERVKYFPSAVTTFAGFRDFDPAEFNMLSDMLPHGSVRATFIPQQMNLPSSWESLPGLQIYQMIHNGSTSASGTANMMVSLTVKDVPAMLDLTRLTNPGPFNQRTIEFGNFFGIFSGDQLVAMAGQRLQVREYAEISAVCTHPEHQGHGYARSLLLHQLGLIRQEGRKPMLHVKTDNKAAVALYESLGFEIRRELDVIIFGKR
jgi:ribosomal protein S18 acetylase RimI-like enzyme